MTIVVDKEIFDKFPESMSFLRDIINQIYELKKEIELLKNKDNDKCEHRLEKHIECGKCKPKETFDFMTAVKYMEEGKKVKRKNWFGKTHIFREASYSIILMRYDTDHAPLNLNIDDIKANDWEIFE